MRSKTQTWLVLTVVPLDRVRLAILARRWTGLREGATDGINICSIGRPPMQRREFLTRTATGLSASWLGSKVAFPMAAPSATRFSATDMVTLGKTGIRTTRLAMGTGTVGYEHLCSARCTPRAKPWSE